MMAVILSLQQQLKDSRDSAAATMVTTGVAMATTVSKTTTSNHGNSGAKERTSGRHNGPVETAPIAMATPSSSAKSIASRSSDS